MLTSVTYTGSGGVNLSIAVTDGMGNATDPVGVTAKVYKAGTAGTLTLMGSTALAKQAGSTGFWGAGHSIKGYPVGNYVVMFEVTWASGTNVSVATFDIKTDSGGSSFNDDPSLYITKTVGPDWLRPPYDPNID